MPNKNTASNIQASHKRTAKNSVAISKRMPVYTCDCGVAILIVPDVEAMNKAIQQHLRQHRKATGDCLTEDRLAQEIIKTLGNPTFTQHPI